jgi:hypothetical protein
MTFSNVPRPIASKSAGLMLVMARPQQDKMGFYDLSDVDLASGTTAVNLVEDP